MIDQPENLVGKARVMATTGANGFLALALTLVLVLGRATGSIQAAGDSDSKAEASPNLIRNSSFEEGVLEFVDGWTFVTWGGSTAEATWDDSTAHTGAMSVRVTNLQDPAGGNLNGWRTTYRIETVPGSNYVLSAWIKTEAVRSLSVGVLIAWHDRQGNFVGNTERWLKLPPSGTTDWTKLELELNQANIPPGAATAEPWLIVRGTGKTAGSVWFDDVSFVAVKAPQSSTTGSNLLRNAGFEEGAADAVEGWVFVTWGKSTASGVWDTGMAHGGERSIRISDLYDPEGGNIDGWRTNYRIRITPGQPYSYSAWVKAEAVRDLDVGIMVAWHDTQGNYVGMSNQWLVLPEGGSTDWTELTLGLDTSNIPANAATAEPWLVVRARSGMKTDGRVWFDDVRFTTRGD